MTPRSIRFDPARRKLRKRIERRDARAREASEGSAASGAVLHRHDDGDASPSEEFEDTRSSPDSRPGLTDMVLGFFRRRRQPLKPEERGAPAPSDDPVRQILAIPRGAARLDAFEHQLAALAAETHGKKIVALAFHRELTSMASEAAVDLALLGARVEACGHALVEVGELERAGELFLSAGKKERAATLFSEAGAVEKLDAVSFTTALDGGLTDARLATARIDTLLSVGRRADALALMDDVERRFPRSEDVRARARAVRARLPDKGRVGFRFDAGVLVVDDRWPVVLGRGEETALPLTSPVLSREHAELRVDGDAVVLVARTPRARLTVDGESANDRALAAAGTLSLDGVVLSYRLVASTLSLSLDDGRRSLAVPRAARAAAVVDAPVRLRVSFDEARRAVLTPVGDTRLNGEQVREACVLFVDDVLVVDGRALTVTRA